MIGGSFLKLYVLAVLAIPLILSISCSKEEWDYVVLGDSSAWGFPEYYAAHIEEDLGVKVTVHDWTVGGLSSGKLLSMLRDDEELRETISKAEVISYCANPGDHIGWHIITGEGRHDCSAKALVGYKSDLDRIINEIFSLRKGKPTLIRAMDFYVPIHSEWRERGKYEENRRCWTAFNETIHEAAAEFKIPVARVYDAFNGANHGEDPREKGYIGDDGLHTNEIGQKVIADQFRKLGYEPITP
ncbi:hypothetical protein AMJ83_01570 [candidate division WOR_3 bacterium SM23_42]|uniref:Uncharacterized protein n=1 Tax=candidate division WOR_3 bacterium SM23_42 TaxID=1703779 RepID=A0A0S8FV47_UNCW3|nr:MAG: hypothetical protein AMJ83_01570 [candidate division WOR_3 bacterium SM23_42]